MKLNEEQLNFLKYHEIPLRYIFDATGIRPRDFKVIMKDLGMIGAIGVTLCGICNRGLKDRHNHCLFCNTSVISFRKRKYTPGFVYVVGSEKGKILKVGFTEDFNDRLKHLNNNKYGGVNDWEIIFKGKYDNGGDVENYIHTELKDYIANTEYNNCGRNIICYETFKCSWYNVRKIIDKMNLELYSVAEEYFLPGAFEKYDFDDVKSYNKRIGNSNL